MGFRNPMVYHSKLYLNNRMGEITFDGIFFNVSKKYNFKNETTLVDYIEDAHHRWNLFARGLYGDLGRHSFITAIPEDANITREEAEKRREEGLNSDLYKVAKQRMESLAHISIFERMEESMELLCWTFCWNEDKIPFEFKDKTGIHTSDDLEPDVREAFEKYHNIDVQLYQDALELFDKRYEEMKSQKGRGIMCNLRRVCPISSIGHTEEKKDVEELNVVESVRDYGKNIDNIQETKENRTSTQLNESKPQNTETTSFYQVIENKNTELQCDVLDARAEEQISAQLPIRKIWQIAVPHTGTTTLENVLKSAVQQDIETRFKGNTNVCVSCNTSDFEYYLSINSTLQSGGHADWTVSNQFQNVNDVRAYFYLDLLIN